MALNFQPYQDRAGEETRNRWSNSLDSIFNQYMASRQNARADQAAAQQAQLAQQQIASGSRTAADAELSRAAQFGPRLSEVDQAQAIGQSAPNFTGPANPRFAKFLEGFNALSQKPKMAAEAQQEDINVKKADVKVKEAQAEALGRDQIYVDPDTGRQIIVPKGAKLIPRIPQGKQPVNPDLNAAMELYETAKQGLMSGLGGSETGAFAGLLPAVTAKQQIAKGSVAAMAPVLKQLFRTAGEGVFTDRDQALLLDMVPGRTDLPEAREAMIANIDAIVKAKLKASNRIQTPSSESAPSQLTPTQSARLAELRAKRGR